MEITKKHRIAVKRVMKEIYDSKMGDDLRQCQKEFMKVHGSDFRKMRKDYKPKEATCQANQEANG